MTARTGPLETGNRARLSLRGASGDDGTSDDAGDPNRVLGELYGELQAFPDDLLGTWQIGGEEFKVTADTELKPGQRRLPTGHDRQGPLLRGTGRRPGRRASPPKSKAGCAVMTTITAMTSTATMITATGSGMTTTACTDRHRNAHAAGFAWHHRHLPGGRHKVPSARGPSATSPTWPLIRPSSTKSRGCSRRARASSCATGRTRISSASPA
ncbi:MAG: hypothetical protein R3A10_11405 [Caldilineaceae bacterium]